VDGSCQRNFQQKFKVCYIGVTTSFIFKMKMIDLETNVSVTLEVENALEQYYYSKFYIGDESIEKGQGAHWGEVGSFGSQCSEGLNEV
jgi:hypothetical protein